MKRRIKKKKHSRWSKTALKAFDMVSNKLPLTQMEKQVLKRLRAKTKKAEKGW